MKKELIIKVNLKDRNIYDSDMFIKNHLYIHKNEYPNLIPKKKITDEDLNKAIDTIIGYFILKDISYIMVDLDERNMLKTELVEMTMNEIEKIIGHKIKIKGDTIKLYSENNKTYAINEKYNKKEK